MDGRNIDDLNYMNEASAVPAPNILSQNRKEDEYESDVGGVDNNSLQLASTVYYEPCKMKSASKVNLNQTPQTASRKINARQEDSSKKSGMRSRKHSEVSGSR